MSFADYRVDKNTPIPLYYQLKQIILSEIQKAAVGPNETIPTEEEFCNLYLISRTTVRQAVTELVNEGRLYRVKSKGTFVAPPPPPQLRTDLSHMYTSFVADVKSLQMRPVMKVNSIQVVTSNPEVTTGLGLDEPSPVIRVRRNQLADQTITSFIETFMLYPQCDQVMDPKKLERQSLYTTLNEREETAIGRVIRRISAHNASAVEARALDIAKGAAINLVVNQGFSKLTGKPIVYEWVRYIGDKNVLVLDVGINQNEF